jgi:PTH1 family peptidyl-tRNA hydrolase
VGLGNPGNQYARTRHNIGFMVAEELARRFGIPLTTRKYEAFFGSGHVGGKRVSILLPQTYMNLSGRSVAPAHRFLKPEEGGMIVVHDEVDLPFGAVRLKWAGGNAGHNGLRSIDADLGKPGYYRVRMGVGRPPFGAVRDWVLSRFPAEDAGLLEQTVDLGADAVERLLRDGLVDAQNTIHAQGERAKSS